MAARSVALTTIKGGINRLRTKGAALNDSLFDLLNGYVTAARTVKGRPGTFRHADLADNTIPGLTKGLCAFDGTLHVFATSTVDVPIGFTLHVIQHPAGKNDDGTDIDLLKIHFAAPFMGFLYVVAEFAEVDTLNELGNIFHYWIQTGDVWEAEKMYRLGDVVTPAIPTGFSYQATRLTAPFPSWAPNVQRVAGTFGDTIEPTVYNDFFYVAVDALGDNPRSGATEPDWPEEDGAQIFEDAEGGVQQQAISTPQPGLTEEPPPFIRDRYSPGLQIP